jgi:hypothetical protein
MRSGVAHICKHATEDELLYLSPANTNSQFYVTRSVIFAPVTTYCSCFEMLASPMQGNPCSAGYCDGLQRVRLHLGDDGEPASRLEPTVSVLKQNKSQAEVDIISVRTLAEKRYCVASMHDKWCCAPL